MPRDAVRRLEQEDDLRTLLGRPEGDMITRFPGIWFWRKDFEALYKNYGHFVSVEIDSNSGVSSSSEVRRESPAGRIAVAGSGCEPGHSARCTGDAANPGVKLGYERGEWLAPREGSAELCRERGEGCMPARDQQRIRFEHEAARAVQLCNGDRVHLAPTGDRPDHRGRVDRDTERLRPRGGQ